MYLLTEMNLRADITAKRTKFELFRLVEENKEDWKDNL